jgi:hypothetical protein
MGPALGKRKRVTREELEAPSRSPSPSSDSGNSDGEDLQDIFRKAFEAKFKPLDVEPKKSKLVEADTNIGEELEKEEESDWSGISDEDGKVEVVEYADTRGPGELASKADLKAFMVQNVI